MFLPIFSFLRPLGKFVPPTLLWVGFWPISAAGVAWNLLRQPQRAAPFARLPPPLRPGGSRWLFWPALWLQQTQVRAARRLDRWPDAFARARWRSRIKLAGDAPAIAALRFGARPVVLYGFHFGPVEMIADLVRSYGLPCAVIHGFEETTHSARRRAVNGAADAAHGLAGVPRRFLPAQTRRMFTFLGHKGVLGGAATTFGEGSVAVQAEGVCTRLAPGLLRLARQTGAVVIPVVILAGPWARVTLRLGRAVAQSDLDAPESQQKICEEFFAFFLSVAKAAPGQLYPHFAGQIQRMEGAACRLAADGSALAAHSPS